MKVEVLKRHFGSGSSIDDSGGMNSAIKGFCKEQFAMGYEVEIFHKIRFWRFEKIKFCKEGIFKNDFISKTDHYHFAYSAFFMMICHPRIFYGGENRLFHFHGPWYKESIAMGNESRFGSYLKFVIEKIVYSQFKVFWCASDSFADILSEDFGVPRQDIVVTALGVDTDFFKPTRPIGLQDKSQMGPFTIKTIRRLVPRMGLRNLIKVVSELKDVNLEIAGVGPEKDYLQSLILQENAKDRIKLIGHIEKNRIPYFYSTADLCVIPSKSLEGFCISALEAMACGVPVLASNLQGLTYTVGSLSEQLMFEPDNADALQSAIVNFRSNKHLQSLDFRGHAMTFSWPKVVIKLEAELSKRFLT